MYCLHTEMVFKLVKIVMHRHTIRIMCSYAINEMQDTMIRNFFFFLIYKSECRYSSR